ncbi:MAG TPA: hypothetical protein VFC00_37880 [Micromonosporaceae bacterium]|nr:hypothetical protein [Micromonosporaceae bacterium]
MDTSAPPRAVQALVSHRIHGGAELPAWRYGTVLVRDESYHRHAGPRRYFWLLDHEVQLVYEPFGWIDEWYVDVVTIRQIERGGRLVYDVSDALVDLVVEGMGPTYRMIDLDELADSVRAAHVAPSDAADILARTQRFLDSYLHRGAPFPPPQIRPYFAADHHYPPLP